MLDFVNQLLLGLPLGGKLLLAVAQVGEFFFDFLDLGFVALALDSLALNLLLGDQAGDFIESLGHRVNLEAELGGGLVDQVDGLVGEESVGDVTLREGDGGDNRLIADAHLVVVLVAFLQSAQDGDGGGLVRLVDHHFLETTLEGLVLLEVFLIFVESGRSYRAQFAAGKSRLEDICGIHGTLAFTGTHESVDFVDKEDDFAVRTGHFVDDGLESLLKFTFVLRTGHKRAHVERVDLLGAQIFGHIAAHYSLGEALGDGCLAGARLADEHGVVFGAPR